MSSTVVWGNLAGRGNLAHFKNLNWEHCGGHVSIIKVQVDAEIFNFIIFLLQNKNWDFLHSYNILKIIFEKNISFCRNEKCPKTSRDLGVCKFK